MALFSSQPSIDLDRTKALGKKWMVIDGALLNDAHLILPKQFVKNDKSILYKNLFIGTKWNDIADVGPLLISYHPEIEVWAQAQRPWRFGLVFESDEPLKALAKYWLTLSDCQHQGLEGSLSRLYDGIIFYHVLNQADDVRQASWLGPIKRIWLPDYANQRYFYTERPDVNNPPPLEMVSFTDPEWQGLSVAKRYLVAHKSTLHLDMHFPEYWAGKTEKHAHVMEQLTVLAALGEMTQQDIIYYMNVLGRLGDIWDKDSPHKNIASLLEDKAQPLTIRLETANQLAFEYTLSSSENKEATA